MATKQNPTREDLAGKIANARIYLDEMEARQTGTAGVKTEALHLLPACELALKFTNAYHGASRMAKILGVSVSPALEVTE